MARKTKTIEVKATEWKRLVKQADSLRAGWERVGKLVAGNAKSVDAAIKLKWKIDALLSTLAEIDAANEIDPSQV